MKPYKKKKLLRQQIKKFLSRKKEIMETVKPLDKKISKLQQKLADIESEKLACTVTQVDHAAGSYDIVEYGDETEEQEIV